MAIKKIGLSWITTADFKKAQHFFVDTLGLEACEINDQWGWMELKAQGDDAIMGVGKQGEDDGFKAGTNGVITFTVDDIIQTKKELEAKGVSFVGDIVEVPNIVKMATFRDPDGNLFQLIESLPGNL